MAFEFDDAIGTGQTYTSPATWETARNTGTFTGDRRGRCLGEEFENTSTFTVNGSVQSYWLILTANDGDEHDGTVHAVSGAGNARLKAAVTSSQLWVFDQDKFECSWLEFRSIDTDLSTTDAWMTIERNDNLRLHHNIVYSSGLPGRAIELSGVADDQYIYRNIIYGSGGGSGIYVDTAPNTEDGNRLIIMFNTLFECDNIDGSILTTGEPTPYEIYTAEIIHNAVFDNREYDINVLLTSSTTVDNNATSDNTGDSGDGLVLLDKLLNFTAPGTDPYTTTDLTLRGTSADLYSAATINSYSSSTFPDIDVPISDRSGTIPLTRRWSVGADDFITGDVEPELWGTDLYYDLKIEPKSEEIANSISVKSAKYTKDSTVSVIYESDDIYEITTGTSKIVVLEFDSAPVDSASGSVSVIIEGGSPVIGTTEFYAWGASVTVDGTVGDRFKLYATAKKYETVGENIYLTEDDESISVYGVQAYEFPENQLLQSETIANVIGENLLLVYKNLRKDAQVRWPGNLIVELADIVRVTEYKDALIETINSFYIKRQKLNFNGALVVTSDVRRFS